VIFEGFWKVEARFTSLFSQILVQIENNVSFVVHFAFAAPKSACIFGSKTIACIDERLSCMARMDLAWPSKMSRVASTTWRTSSLPNLFGVHAEKQLEARRHN